VLRQRFGRRVTPELADTELQLEPDCEDVTYCPTLAGHARGFEFIVCKIARERYGGRFFGGDGDASGSGLDVCGDPGEGVLDRLRLQSDHERIRAGSSSGATASSANLILSGLSALRPPPARVPAMPETARPSGVTR
jgi:hypothetical protein